MAYPSPEVDQVEKIFKSLPLSDQVAAMYEMLRYVRAQGAILQKTLLDLSAEVQLIKNDVANAKFYTEDRLDTTQKIKRVLDGRFDWSVWFRDKVLPAIVTAVVVSVLVLTFGSFGSP